MSCTVDASVFVAASHPPDIHHVASLEFLRQVREQTEDLFCPTLILPECSAAIARQTDTSALAERAVALVESFPNLILVPLDASLARRAAQIAMAHRLRGADSIYVAVSETFSAKLITWDREMVQRGTVVVSAFTPTELAEQQEADRRR